MRVMCLLSSLAVLGSGSRGAHSLLAGTALEAEFPATSFFEVVVVVGLPQKDLLALLLLLS